MWTRLAAVVTALDSPTRLFFLVIGALIALIVVEGFRSRGFRD